MADRLLGSDAKLFADLPGSVGPVTVTVTDPNGTAIMQNVAAASLGTDRYKVTVNTIAPEGIWTVTWTDNLILRLTQRFSVGQASVGGLTRFDALCQIVAGVGRFYEGQALEAKPNSLVDEGFVGGWGSRQGDFLRFYPEVGDGQLGRQYKVTQYTGSELAFVPRLNETIPANSRYVLSSISFQEAERALRQAVTELSHVANLRSILQAQTVTKQQLVAPPQAANSFIINWQQFNFALTLPNYIRGVSKVFVHGTSTRLRPVDWRMLPARQLVIDRYDLVKDKDLVDLEIVRDMAAPVWDDSILEFDPQPVIARAIGILHMQRARSQTMDRDGHSQRAAPALQEAEGTWHRGVRPLPAGFREVLT